MCGEKLSNSGVVPGKLKEHFATKYPFLAGRDVTCFRRLMQPSRRETMFMTSSVRTSERAQQAMCKVATLIAEVKKPHPVAETLLMPTCREMAKIDLVPESSSKISEVPLSADCQLPS